MLSSASASSPLVEFILQGLRDIGVMLTEKTLRLLKTHRHRRERETGSPTCAELVRLNVDVIVTSAISSVQAAKKATATIPIVFASVGEAVDSGLVSSLARPGGNATGLTFLALELDGKRLELLKEALSPKVTRVAFLSTEYPSTRGDPSRGRGRGQDFRTAASIP